MLQRFGIPVVLGCLLWSGRILAECTAPPTVGVSVATHPDGIPTITVSYSFPDTTSSAQRRVGLQIRDSSGGIGLLGGTHPDSISGTFVVNDVRSCAGSGHFTYEAEAVSCNTHTTWASAPYDQSTEPTVSVSYQGPDDQGHGDVVVTYDFPNTSDKSQRLLEHRVRDAGGVGLGPSHQPLDRSGTWTFPYAMTCRTGTFTHEVIATTCSGEKATDEVPVTVSTKPSVSAIVGGMQENGDIAVGAGFGFPNTDAASQREVGLMVRNAGGIGLLGGTRPEEQYGTWPATLHRACDMSDLTLVARAKSCTGEFDEAESALPKPDRPTVSLALKKGPVAPLTGIRQIEGTIHYDMGKGSANWSISAEELQWTDADGVVHFQPTTVLHAMTPPQRIGSVNFSFTPPSGAQQVTVSALATTCNGADTSDASIDTSCPTCCTNDPVNLSDGNVQLTDADLLPPIANQRLTRTYNSDEQVIALFGRGWTTLFDRRMIVNQHNGQQVISFVTATNDVVTFRGAGGVFEQSWPRGRSAPDVLAYDATSNTYRYRAAHSSELAIFQAADGHLIALRDLTTGREAQFHYGADGLPQSLTDSWSGATWNLSIVNRRVSSIAVAGRPDLTWSYAYDGEGNLTTVTAPGNATWRTYEYTARRMTASRDALGNLIESHTYDANGYGISSIGPGDEISLIEYELPAGTPDEQITRVTYNNGATAEYTLRTIGGSRRPVSVRGACASCGAGDVTRVYDEEGRVLLDQRADGYVTKKTYVAGLLASEERHLRPAGCDPATASDHCRLQPDALAAAVLEPTAASFTTTYEHLDGNWPDAVTGMITPSVAAAGRTRRSDTAYHATTGAVRSSAMMGFTPDEEPRRIERATTTTFYGDVPPCDPEGDGGCPPAGDALVPAFTPGGSYQSSWLSLPQPAGLAKLTDGPRLDVQDVSSFVYYPIDASVPAVSRGRLAAARNAAGHIVHYESYDIFGNPTRIVDANNVATVIAYDTLGRVLTSTIQGVAGCDTSRDPLCATDLTSTTAYSPSAGPMVRQELPAGGVTVYGYDGRGRVQTISRGPSVTDLRERTEYEYDPATGKKSIERMLAFEGAAWTAKRQESFAYDAHARLQAVTHADGTSITYAYDPEDRVRSIRDENHTVPNTSYTYDPAGRLSVVTQSLATAPGGVITTSYGYDKHGNLTAVTDPNGNVTTYTFDDFGQMVRQQSPVTGVTTYEYDSAGDLLSTVDASGVATARTHDSSGRVMTATSSTPSGASEQVTWSYDSAAFGLGRLASMTDPTGQTTYGYERRGLLALEAKAIGATTYTTRYAYDADGNRSRIEYPSSRTVTYTHDYADRPFSAQIGATPLVTSAVYLPFGPPTEIVFGNGTTKRMTFDARYRPMTNELLGADDPLASYSYGHDGAGNITAIHDLQDPSFDRDFVYDDLNRLTQSNTGQALWGSGMYAYDAMGNVRSYALGEQRSMSFAYQGSTPKLTSANMDGVQYDAAGNERVVGATTYEYSARNQLRSANGITYGYDGRGVRTTTARPVRILTLTLTPPSVQGGGIAQGAIVLSSPAPAGGATVALSSSTAIVTVPSSIPIAAGQTTATFEAATQAVSGEVHAVITASFNESQRTADLAVTGSRLDQLSLGSSSIVGGESTTGLVLLGVEAPEEGLSVQLRSTHPSVSVPEQIVVPGGREWIEFPVSTFPVAEPTAVRVIAAVDEEARDASLTILPPSPIALTLTPRSVYGGATVTGTVTLDGVAPEGGITVGLLSGSGLLATPPALAIPAGARSAAFTSTATPVEVTTGVTVSATLGETVITGALTIEPPLLTNLAVTPSAAIGGENLGARAELNAPAAAEGARVALSASDPQFVGAPSLIEVPAGATSESAVLTTGAVSSTTPVVVSATRAGITRSVTVTLQPPPVTLASFSVTPGEVVGSNEATGNVTLTGPAPEGGVAIELTSGDSLVAAVPPAVSVAAGATQASFTIATSLVTTASNVVITAWHGTVEKAMALTVLPPTANYVSAVSVMPPFIVGGTTASAEVALHMPSSDAGGSEVLLTSSMPSAVSVPSSVKVSPNATVQAFTISTAPVTGPVEAVITASYGGVVRRAKVIVARENSVTVQALTIEPARVTGGTIASGTVTLNEPAPFGAATVVLETHRRTMITMPATVLVPEGATSAAFVIATEPLHGPKDRGVEITATYNGVTAGATLTIAPTNVTSTSTRTPVLCAAAALEPCLTRTALDIAANAVTAFEQQYSLYTPELNLLAETAAAPAGSPPPIAYEYIWFGGQPVAQIDVAANEILYTYTNHLGTPILQTDASARVVWRVEYEPYGNVYAFRRGEARHQPLRFPGQESDGQELSYNIFRWYRAGWGRYTQPDPVGLQAGTNLFTYVHGNPIKMIDPFGLKAELVCKNVGTGGTAIPLSRHCRLRVTCDTCPGGKPEIDVTVGMEYTGNPLYSINEWPYPSGLQGYSETWPVAIDGKECDFTKCVRAYNKLFSKGFTGQATQYVPAYSFLGPNSNTYAARLIEICGGLGAFPPGAVGAPGAFGSSGQPPGLP